MPPEQAPVRQLFEVPLHRICDFTGHCECGSSVPVSYTHLFGAVASDDDLRLPETIVLEDRLADTAAMVVVDSVDGVVENDQRRFDALSLRQKDCESQAADVPLAEGG